MFVATILLDSLLEDSAVVLTMAWVRDMELIVANPAFDCCQIHLFILLQTAPDEPSDEKQEASLVVLGWTFAGVDECIAWDRANPAGLDLDLAAED